MLRSIEPAKGEFCSHGSKSGDKINKNGHLSFSKTKILCKKKSKMDTEFWNFLCSLNKDSLFTIFAEAGIKTIKDLQQMSEQKIEELGVGVEDFELLKRASLEVKN